MIYVMSGEGPTDIGTCNNGAGTCTGDEFKPGPMTHLIDSLIEKHHDFSPLAHNRDAYIFIGKGELVDRAKAKREQRSMALAGKGRAQETGYFYINAWMLGEIALEHEQKNKQPSVAVLFRDSDGTNSTPADWNRKFDSICQGFARAGHTRGVPMLPKPKSEAWLLCAVKDNPYQGCDVLEDLPGNDAAPNSAKMRLDEALDGRSSAGEICTWLSENDFDHDRTANQMASYESFKAPFIEAITRK
ncbi:hypothetical protein [Burkholderia sp. Ac-20392]|uniref:hypothetical protein n=1 Tax=Burkholderia sp. Ac-20392 TaxID=2703905 RepID=UPI00197D2C34|nr:hypothetical protein [Burkholderia sp. Ac-20392]MBN3794578.1 hypothetical protein [Burkholderia sp. Ac-20392]